MRTSIITIYNTCVSRPRTYIGIYYIPYCSTTTHIYTIIICMYISAYRYIYNVNVPYNTRVYIQLV